MGDRPRAWADTAFCTPHSAICIQMVPEVGIAPTSPPLQGGANLPQLLGVKRLAEPTLSEPRMVVPAGNAPASPGYRPGALLLSYGTVADTSNAPIDSEPHRSTVVIELIRRARRFRHRRKDLPLLLACDFGGWRSGFLPPAPQPLRQVLDNSHMSILWLRVNDGGRPG